jgi:hypothetical protein
MLSLLISPLALLLALLWGAALGRGSSAEPEAEEALRKLPGYHAERRRGGASDHEVQTL